MDFEAIYKEPLEKIPGAPDEIQRLSRRPDLVVREIKASAEETREEVRAKIEQANPLFDALRADYGVRMIRRKIVGKNLGATAPVYLVSEFVKGTNLDGGTNPDKLKLMMQEIESTTKGILSMLLNAYKEQKTYLCDITLRQFKMGKTKKDSEEHLYLVDIEPQILTPDSSDEASRLGRWSFKAILKEVGIIEKTLGRKFTELTPVIKEAIENLSNEKESSEKQRTLEKLGAFPGFS